MARLSAPFSSNKATGYSIRAQLLGDLFGCVVSAESGYDAADLYAIKCVLTDASEGL